MRVSLPVVGLLAAGGLLAAVYVSGRGADNAPTGDSGQQKAETTSPAAAGARHNSGKVAAFVYKSAPEPVPAFQFFDGEQRTKTIEAFKGKVVLLNLWATWCGPCREEMPALDRLQKAMGSDKFEVVAVSVDSVYSLKIFADREQYPFPILSDFWPHGEIAQRYGVFNDEQGFANRGTFLIDADGIVRFSEMNEPGQGRDSDDWLAAIAALPARHQSPAEAL